MQVTLALTLKTNHSQYSVFNKQTNKNNADPNQKYFIHYNYGVVIAGPRGLQ